MEQTPAISIRDLVKRYAPAGKGEGKLALEGVSLTSRAGKCSACSAPMARANRR